MESFPQTIQRRLSVHSLLLLAVLALSAFLRFYKLGDFLTFLGDEGRDVRIVRRMITEPHPALIGPQTSIGNMYLGPLYYYLIAFPLLVFSFSPLGPATFVAALGVATVGLVYYVGRSWYGTNGALVASFLFAISPPAILYSRSSWNPNIMPFFALLALWSLYQVWHLRRSNYFVQLAVAFAFVLNSHYLGLLLLPTIAIFTALSCLQKDRSQLYTKHLGIGILVFLLLLSPLHFFDFRHNFINSRAISKFFTIRQETVNLKPYKSIPHIPSLMANINASLLSLKVKSESSVATALLVLALLFSLLTPATRKPGLLLTSWLFFGLVGLGLYKQNIYEHYYGFLFPVPFLVFGSLYPLIPNHPLRGLIKLSLFLLFIYLAFKMFGANPLFQDPNFQMSRTEAVSDFIAGQSDQAPFNMALISKRNYDAGYRYFLELSNTQVARIEDKITSQLYVICEDPVCQPINHPIAEIANFGWAKIERVWVFPWGVRLFRLGHKS